MKQFRGEVTSNLLIIIFAFIGIATLVATIRVYFIHGHIYFWTDIDTDTFSAFGEFIGGVVGTIFTIIATILVWQTYQSQKEELKLTRRLIEKQTELTYKPDLFIDTTEIQIEGSEQDGILIPKLLSMDSIRDKATIPVINYGREAAKKIEIEWVYSPEMISETFNDELPNSKISFFVDKNQNAVSYKFPNGDTNSFLFHKHGSKAQIDILIPNKSKEDKKNIVLPIDYLLSFAVYKTFLTQENNSQNVISFNEITFPELKLHMNYIDIAGGLHKKIFKIIINTKYYVYDPKKAKDSIFEDMKSIGSFEIESEEIWN